MSPKIRPTPHFLLALIALIVLIVSIAAPAAHAAAIQERANPSMLEWLSQLEMAVKPAIIWGISAGALILSIAAFFVPPARRAYVSGLVLAVLAAAGIWQNWHVGLVDLLSGAISFSSSPAVLQGVAVLAALALALLFFTSSGLLVLTWGRGGYLLLGLVTAVGLWGMLAHIEVLPNPTIWEQAPRQEMGGLGFVLSASSALGFLLSGLMIVFEGGRSKIEATPEKQAKIAEVSPPGRPSPTPPPTSTQTPKSAPAPQPAGVGAKPLNQPAAPIPAKPTQKTERVDMATVLAAQNLASAESAPAPAPEIAPKPPQPAAEPIPAAPAAPIPAPTPAPAVQTPLPATSAPPQPVSAPKPAPMPVVQAPKPAISPAKPATAPDPASAAPIPQIPQPQRTISPALASTAVANPKPAAVGEVAPELERSTNQNSAQPSISWQMKKGVWSRG